MTATHLVLRLGKRLLRIFVPEYGPLWTWKLRQVGKDGPWRWGCFKWFWIVEPIDLREVQLRWFRVRLQHLRPSGGCRWH